MSNVNEAERTAQELQERLKNFAVKTNRDRADDLNIICNELLNVDNNILSYLEDSESQQRLIRAVGTTLRTPFKLADDRRVIPWAGGYTIVAIDKNGVFKAALSNPVGRVYENHGTNLNPYALTKAVERLHLFLSIKSTGLENSQNYNLIQEIRGRRHPVYLGEAMSEKFLSSDEDLDPVILGASGCELTPEYQSSLAPDLFKLPTTLRKQADALGPYGFPKQEAADLIENTLVDFAAGYADMVFAQRVANYLSDPFKIGPVKEPEFFSLLRRSH